ncbi:MAG TPA: hypothetical protein VNM22_00775 [Candidatus Limnocylindrales bacterium]|nr:hypothetical protein [Candidatus Limnocylindrales bacterium]
MNSFVFAGVSGDFNGDGYNDLAIGDTAEDLSPSPQVGTVVVLHGWQRGLMAGLDGGPDDQLWFQGHNGMEDLTEFGDGFGWALSSGAGTQ